MKKGDLFQAILYALLGLVLTFCLVLHFADCRTHNLVSRAITKLDSLAGPLFADLSLGIVILGTIGAFLMSYRGIFFYGEEKGQGNPKPKDALKEYEDSVVEIRAIFQRGDLSRSHPHYLVRIKTPDGKIKLYELKGVPLSKFCIVKIKDGKVILEALQDSTP